MIAGEVRELSISLLLLCLKVKLCCLFVSSSDILVYIMPFQVTKFRW